MTNQNFLFGWSFLVRDVEGWVAISVAHEASHRYKNGHTSLKDSKYEYDPTSSTTSVSDGGNVMASGNEMRDLGENFPFRRGSYSNFTLQFAKILRNKLGTSAKASDVKTKKEIQIKTGKDNFTSKDGVKDKVTVVGT